MHSPSMATESTAWVFLPAQGFGDVLLQLQDPSFAARVQHIRQTVRVLQQTVKLRAKCPVLELRTNWTKWEGKRKQSNSGARPWL